MQKIYLSKMLVPPNLRKPSARAIEKKGVAEAMLHHLFKKPRLNAISACASIGTIPELMRNFRAASDTASCTSINAAPLEFLSTNPIMSL
jgi:hypothetical protein